MGVDGRPESESVVEFYKIAEKTMKMIMLIVILLSLTGCGMTKYRTKIIVDGKEKAVLESNVPSKATVDGVEIDQRSSGSWWEKILPQKIEVQK